METLPRFLTDFAPLAGTIKADYTDFVVEEVPLYPADGEGPHTYFWLEKAGLSTFQVVQDLARALSIRRHQIGFAGLKDARAVTRQWFSIEHLEPERLQALELPRIRILAITRHRNKLRLGHLRGNRFVIRVRDTDAGRGDEARAALARLTAQGVPNYFGEQRFGYRGDTWEIGRALVAGNPDEAMDLILGRPGPADHGTIRRAREDYDAGRYEEAVQHWPRMFRNERQALRAIANNKGKKRRGLWAYDRSAKAFFVSSFQSYLFNEVVRTRLPHGLGQLWLGDLACRHGPNAVFRVEDVAREQPRADSFEISPTGPLFGYRMTEAQGAAGEMEAAVLKAAGLTLDRFHQEGVRTKGARRALRFRPADTELTLGADLRGPYLQLGFTLPRGCYATALLRELFRPEAVTAAAPEAEGADVSDTSD
ncbi:MAG: tRNA pseudouridine(13) synthase TruD [Phycisphaerales bacterium]|nr:tRNA pseudouridine(13) synthase TruD [Phycisphaerales bacterium]